MHKKLLALAVILTALVPVMAAGRAACCIRGEQATVSRGCCGMMGAQGGARKGCCKAPAQRLDASASEAARLATAYASIAVAAPAIVLTLTPAAPALRLARLAHRADSPDESPPDLLSQNSILLI